MTRKDYKTTKDRLVKVTIVLAILSEAALTASAAGPVNDSAMAKAYALYNQQKYAESAAAFEALIAASTPNARLYYYAALANRANNRTVRAKQLCQYVIANFGGTTEASYAQRLYPDAAAKTANSPDALPDDLKGKNIQELMKTEQGRKAVEDALAKKESATALAAAKVSPMIAKSKGGRMGDRVFNAADIARDGANGIDQMFYPNCWFESSMSALAMLPRGQKLMADMIRYGDKAGNYVVRFPGDGEEYKITEEKLEKSGIHDKALWATLIECGQTLKFPDDNGGMLVDGLGCLTGQKAEMLLPSSASEQELTSFIDSAVKSQNPIICGSQYMMSSSLPRLVVPSHAYTIIGFDSASGMIKIRNPHGANAQRFTLKNDDNHRKFEQLDDGVFKIHISIFPMYFSQIARAFI